LQAQNLHFQIFVHYIAFDSFTVWSPDRHHSTTNSVALTHEHQFSGARSHLPNNAQLHHITPSICPAKTNVTPAFSGVMYSIASSSSYTAETFVLSLSVHVFISPGVPLTPAVATWMLWWMPWRALLTLCLAAGLTCLATQRY